MAITTRHFLQTAGTVLAGLVLAACGKQEPPAPVAVVEPTPIAAPAPAPMVVTVGTDAAYAPFESENEKGEVVGFDIEVVQAIAAKAGVEVKFLNTPWEGIFNTLAQGDRDMLVSAITITEERKQTVDFSDPYFDAQQLIAVRGDSKIANFAALKKLKVGVQNGTTGDEVVSKLQGKGSANIKRFESTPLALKELEAGGVDAVVADNGVLVHYVNNNTDAKFKTINDTSFETENYGMAVKKGNTELLAKLNKGLADIKADGSYDAIYTKYFGAPTVAPAPAEAASQ